MCDASNFGIGAALLQSHSGTNKMNLISANSRLFTQAELRLSTLMRECTAIIYTLTEYEFLILDQNIQQFYSQIINQSTTRENIFEFYTKFLFPNLEHQLSNHFHTHNG